MRNNIAGGDVYYGHDVRNFYVQLYWEYTRDILFIVLFSSRGKYVGKCEKPLR